MGGSFLLNNGGRVHNFLLVDRHVHFDNLLHVDVMGTLVLLNRWHMNLNLPCHW